MAAQISRVSESAQEAHATVDKNGEGLNSLQGAITRFKM
jgi:peptidoglycan hydrolase CwlO-like protein